MSENSSNNSESRPLSRLKTRFKRSKKEKRIYNWRMLVILPSWVVVAFVLSNLIIAGVLIVSNWFHVPLDTLVRPAILQTAIATLIYILTIGIAVTGPYLLKRKDKTTSSDLGLDRLVSWADIGLAPLTFLVYTVVVAVVLQIVISLIPAFLSDQAQDVGFKAFGSRSDNLLAFATLVVLAPLAEETLFRGYLFGKLKKYVPSIVAALATSILFGVAHFQWNVGIDVFVLSMFLCGLRSLTGSIWAGILVHMIKNGIAYYILFISPVIGG
jgi:membrane protease YdiL (CAAX protease family)